MILCDDGSSHALVLRGRMVNRSDSGLGLYLRTPIAARAYVSFRVEQSGPTGTACVRHCTLSKMDYLIGLEYSRTFHKPANKL